MRNSANFTYKLARLWTEQSFECNYLEGSSTHVFKLVNRRIEGKKSCPNNLYSCFLRIRNITPTMKFNSEMFAFWLLNYTAKESEYSVTFCSANSHFDGQKHKPTSCEWCFSKSSSFKRCFLQPLSCWASQSGLLFCHMEDS